MDSAVLEFDIGMGNGDDDDIDIEPPNDDDEVLDCSSNEANSMGSCGAGADNTSFAYIPQVEIELEPCDRMEFESEESAKAFYNSYARRVGFSTRVSTSRRSRKDGAIIQRTFVCAKEGFRNPNEKRMRNKEIKRPRSITRVGCKAFMSVKVQDSGKWVVSAFVKEHNHELVPQDQVHCLRSHRQISGPAKTLIDTLQAAGMGPRKIMSVLVKEYGGISKVGFTEVDCRNYMRNNKMRSYEGDVQIILDYMKKKQSEDPSFFYAVQGDGDQGTGTGNVFWADPKARSDYRFFGDTITFDTTYRSNRYRLPFVPFTGLNNHGQPVLFGCAFLVNESVASFVWLFNSWLEAMYGRSPVSITTEHDSVIRSAVVQVFPNARHRFCKWHIYKQCQEKLSNVMLNHPQFEAALQRCVNLSDSIDEFESCWQSLVDKYGLSDHKWLQSIYAHRNHWVPVYLRETFFAEMSMTQRSDSMNSYFDGYINASTHMNHFFNLYEKAMESRYEKEVKADFETVNTSPVLRTPSPMEKQASEFYTRKLFIRFQEELINTLTLMTSEVESNGEVITYRVSKYGEEHKACLVGFNVLEMKANCSCQMFQFSGILCRHVLAIFRVSNVLTLPTHYIMKRWTRNAKSSVVLEDQVVNPFNNYLESHTVRYNTLRHKAFKFVEEGAETVESYNVAVAALEEASRKVATAAKNEGKTSYVPPRGQSCLAHHHSEDGQGSSMQQLSESELDEKISELTMELELANQKCEAYRTNLMFLVKEMEDHKQCLSIEVENIKLGMKGEGL